MNKCVVRLGQILINLKFIRAINYREGYIHIIYKYGDNTNKDITKRLSYKSDETFAKQVIDNFIKVCKTVLKVDTEDGELILSLDDIVKMNKGKAVKNNRYQLFFTEPYGEQVLLILSEDSIEKVLDTFEYL